MSNSVKNKSSADKNLTVTKIEGKTPEQQIAELSLSPIVLNAYTAANFSKFLFGSVNANEAVGVIRDQTKKVESGDLSEVENTLTAQAIALDAMFNELARRAALNMGEHMNATEMYMRLAFKAQSQCRTTLETLAEIKYPKAATFVRQQNVAYQQQVNNDGMSIPSNTRTPAHAHGKKEIPANELLNEADHEKVDSRGTDETIRVNSPVETVGAVNRGKNTGRKGSK
ncbi:hypothetical protein [Undibacterium sp. Ji49W]|uniref:hypothetical protein n=1 Tax=Undibacterium sp. Ji49W TaxID=3413040 RepID=UPI003BF39D74